MAFAISPPKKKKGLKEVGRRWRPTAMPANERDKRRKNSVYVTRVGRGNNNSKKEKKKKGEMEKSERKGGGIPFSRLEKKEGEKRKPIAQKKGSTAKKKGEQPARINKKKKKKGRGGRLLTTDGNKTFMAAIGRRGFQA